MLTRPSNPARPLPRPPIAICVLLLGVFLLSACNGASNPATPTPFQPDLPGDSDQSGDLPGWLSIYFTNPTAPDRRENGIDRVVVAALESATQSIDVASFDFDLPGITQALVEASQRGVQVRLVLDFENGLEVEGATSADKQVATALAALRQANLPLVDGSRQQGLMHDKMILIDGQILFTGSWNLTYSDTFSNNNNLLKITDPRLIANYQAKFNELFVEQRYGSLARVGAQIPVLALEGGRVENYFSPPDKVMAHILDNVSRARQSIYFMAYTFTDRDLADELIARASAGVVVRGVVDARSASQGTLARLTCAGITVKIDGNPYAMHHKVIIIDEAIVITGSFNFTLSADTVNDENILILHNPAVARLYLDEYERIAALGNRPDPADIQCNTVK